MALQRASNNTRWSEWNEKLERGTSKSHKSDRQRDIQRYARLHENTSHAYSQDVLPFMLRRKGERIHGQCKKKKRKERKWNRNSCSKRHSRLKLDTGAVVIHHRSVNSHNAQGKAVWPWVNCWFYKRFSAPPCGVHPNCNTRVSFRTQTGFPILTNSLSKPASLACSPPKAHLSSITVIKRPNQVCWSRKTNKGKAGWKVYRKTLRLAKRRGSLAWNLNTNSQW